MKIGFVIDDTLDKPDGVQQYVITLGTWYAGQGYEVHYLCGETKRTDLPNIHSLSRNVKVVFNGNRLTMPLLASKRRIKHLLDSEQFDVLHIQMPYSPLLAGRIIRLASPRTAIVGTFHILPLSTFVRKSTWLLGLLLRSSLHRFDFVCAVSPAAQLFAAEAFRLSDIAVVPNVVDVALFSSGKAFEKYDDDVATIMFLGRLVPRKGCSILLHAASILQKRLDSERLARHSFRIIICGRGPLEADLKAEAKRLGIAESVEFTGFVSETDKPRYIASADIMAFPSSGGESFGYVLIEAMAAKRPIVLAGDNPGYASVMHPHPELLFEARDAEELANKIQRYLPLRHTKTIKDISNVDDSTTEANHRESRRILDWQQTYVHQFDVAAVGARLLDSYNEVLRNRLQP